MNSLERQKALYDFLIKQGNDYTRQVEIYNDCEFYPYVPMDNSFHDSQTRKRMTTDIREINSNPDFEKIIISNGNGVKIATEEDYDKMIKSLYKSVFAKLKRIRTIEKKAKRNGQITMNRKEIVAFLNEEHDREMTEIFMQGRKDFEELKKDLPLEDTWFYKALKENEND